MTLAGIPTDGGSQKIGPAAGGGQIAIGSYLSAHDPVHGASTCHGQAEIPGEPMPLSRTRCDKEERGTVTGPQTQQYRAQMRGQIVNMLGLDVSNCFGEGAMMRQGAIDDD
jgi:hypothetical protein